MDFRAYPVGEDGHLMAPVVLHEATDEAAIRRVKAMLNGRPIELWQGSRMLGWFERIDGAVVFLTARHEADSQPAADSQQVVAGQQAAHSQQEADSR